MPGQSASGSKTLTDQKPQDHPEKELNLGPPKKGRGKKTSERRKQTRAWTTGGGTKITRHSGNGHR
ncbi:hypothetical protein C4546_04165 [Candidatus Parcubacteria bacterium]|jgi:hypothetical protein|nr:MAG: hypothetical protein C4546_04165 [Candidatus Parcubacteria bacterium]